MYARQSASGSLLQDFAKEYSRHFIAGMRRKKCPKGWSVGVAKAVLNSCYWSALSVISGLKNLAVAFCRLLGWTGTIDWQECVCVCVCACVCVCVCARVFVCVWLCGRLVGDSVCARVALCTAFATCTCLHVFLRVQTKASCIHNTVTVNPLPCRRS